MTSQLDTSQPAGAAATHDPSAILQLASGFMAAKHLFVASELGVFDALADGAATLDGLAARTGLSTRAARISADAMVALGLLERDGDRYRNSAVSAEFLTGSGAGDLRPLLRMWDKISYPTWGDLAGALTHGPTQELYALDEESEQLATAGVEAHNAVVAQVLSAAFDFSASRNLLDVGGGTGSWSIAIAARWPRLRATVFDIPVVADIARKRLADAGLAPRVTVASGDALTGPLPSGHDVFLIANCVHLWSPSENQEVLRHVRTAASTAAPLLLVDFWTNATHSEPVAAALMAGEFAVHTRNGDVYSVDEARDWLTRTGWRFVEHRPLGGPQSLIVAAAD